MLLQIRLIIEVKKNQSDIVKGLIQSNKALVDTYSLSNAYANTLSPFINESITVTTNKDSSKVPDSIPDRKSWYEDSPK